MTAGSPYAIIVDGYGGKFGQYQLTVTAQQVHLYAQDSYVGFLASAAAAICCSSFLTCASQIPYWECMNTVLLCVCVRVHVGVCYWHVQNDTEVDTSHVQFPYHAAHM